MSKLELVREWVAIGLELLALSGIVFGIAFVLLMTYGVILIGWFGFLKMTKKKKNHTYVPSFHVHTPAFYPGGKTGFEKKEGSDE